MEGGPTWDVKLVGRKAKEEDVVQMHGLAQMYDSMHGWRLGYQGLYQEL